MRSLFKNRFSSIISLFSFVFVAAALMYCAGGKELVKENNFETLKLGSFVEKEFPYISTSMDGTKLGAAFPKDNISARTLALKLGDSSYVCFDTDLLRWTVAWTGKFLPMYLMPQVSYKDYYNKGNKAAQIGGIPKLATGLYPGWTTGSPVFKDTRPGVGKQDIPVWGPIPASDGHWNGVYVYQNQAVLSYSVGTTEVIEMVTAAPFASEKGFQRNFRIHPNSEKLFLTAAEVSDASEVKVTDHISYVLQGAGKDSVTAVAVVGTGARTNIVDQRYLSIEVAPAGNAREFAVLLWKGPVSKLKDFEAKAAAANPAKLPAYQKGGPAIWKGAVYTQGKLGADSEDYVIDQVTLPVPNQWGRNVRLSDVAFWPDGKAAGVTFSGDVWIIEGIDNDLKKVKWTRFASGLHESMSIEIRHNDIYIYDRDGITRLVDLNKDGMADYYENFSNVMEQSPESREWAGSMGLGPDDCFYISKGGALNNGDGPTPFAAKGFRTGSIQSGSILKVSKDGKSVEVLATGLRGPFIGMNPKTGVLTASDQQGNFVPSTPLYLVEKGHFYGVPPTQHGVGSQKGDRPLTWIPHNVDRSAIAQTWINSDKMGPLNGDLIHFSFGRPGLLRVLFDTAANNTVQGGVTFIKANYTAPTSKGRINPKDGMLYIAGFNLWGSSSNGISALQRLRYTGLPSYRPNKFEVGTQGVVLRFDSPLDPNSATDPKNFRVKRWNYLRTEEYGSGHYKLDGTPGQESMPVLKSYLSADKKAVFLLIPDVKEAEQMEVLYEISAADGRSMQDGFWFTPKSVEPLSLNSYHFGDIDLTLLTNQDAIAKASEHLVEVLSAEHGKVVFEKLACVGCHSTGNQVDGMYGPPLKGILGKRREFSDGTSAVANEKYLKESILDPPVKRVKNYSGEMPSYVGVVSDSDIESIILYIKSL